MPPATPQPCPRRQSTEALAAGELLGKPQAEKHLEQCESCRALYRDLTRDRFPAFEGYTILDEMDHGGFGIVYKAFHDHKERIEALKVLFGQTALREQYFENEVHMVARLRHPNIAALYEAHLRDSPPYYAMEFVAGQQLDDYCRAGDVTLEERIRIIRIVASAIGYAHGANVVHRDLKPQNILIDANREPRIVDFGIAKRLGLSPEEGSEQAPPEGEPSASAEGALGTYGYIAPEQIAGLSVDGRADVYGLGVLLFHVITGQPARFATQPERLVEMLRARQVSRADDLAAIISCAVSTDPDQRYPTCAALDSDLDNYLAGRQVYARKDPPTGYRIARLAGVTLRTQKAAVFTALAMLSTVALTWLLWNAELRWLTSWTIKGDCVLIGITPQTKEAIRSGAIGADLTGLNADKVKSWRLLYGKCMERLAEARPRGVVWDYFFPDSRPRYDPAFVAGVEALKRAGTPVVVGANSMNVNADPLMSPAIRQAVHGWGVLLAKHPGARRGELSAPLAIRRGFNPWVPSLAVAGFAAARFPESTPYYEVVGQILEVRYRKPTADPNESHWRTDVDRIPIFEIKPLDQGTGDADLAAWGRLPITNILAHRERAIPIQEVLTASLEQRREWFAGKLVVVGGMVPNEDEHEMQSHTKVFGCQAHVEALNALEAGRLLHRGGRLLLSAWILVWSLVAVALVGILRVSHDMTVRRARQIGITLGLLGVTGALIGVRMLTIPGAVEAVIAACVLLAVGGPAYWLKVKRRRIMSLTPVPAWHTDGPMTSTTVLVSTSSDPSA